MKSMKFPLLCGAIYFFLVSVAHAAGIKIPGLYIYFNIPSHSYQDKIISLLTFGWAVFFYTASSTLSKPLIKSILFIGFSALAMLTFINLSTDFTTLSNDINLIWYHLEVIALFIYSLWLLLCYFKFYRN